ncbi:hypothetical protein DS745_22300 [Anaerobacillus alkaliphilus]|uniref:Uncharacterized protein n=1 Tax=Anaerobacillus alkaliphilus TaxID=1548597 RepID=A0A4Q0VN96_9BACI|nr:hypothetical protein [Anaerobacillus alkaliphilus]RXI96446.1 hypothetical protein DS745_22300 [Anaerobacillus alkaliphilus]
MAKSKAKKQRDHQLRNQKRDVTNSRGIQVDFSTHERKTKTKQEILKKHETKHKRILQEFTHEGDAFLIWVA